MVGNTTKKYKSIFGSIVFLLLLNFQPLSAQEKIVYKTLDTVSLSLEFYYPQNLVENKKYPVMVFFFGGGWAKGNTQQFKPHAAYFAQRGIIGVLADYRVKSRHKTTPFESLKDAKSVIRFLRSNADKYHIDADKIIVAGGSAGGHLAAATATIAKYNDPKDDLNISPKPNALVLFNPVIDNGPGGYGYNRIGEEYLHFSPLHNLRKGAPPTVIFLGTEDHLIPVETAQYYKKVMEKIGSRCDLYLYEGQKHGFFNYKREKYYRQTVAKTDEFLVSLGFLQKP
ncbi:alpha/beta hydrolase [Sinomicrobium sp.]